MGQMTEYVCPACRYRKTVVGGTDSGMLVTLTTILCETCQELEDVVTVQRPTGETFAPACPQGSAHRWRLWKAFGPCPRCGVRMEQGATWLIWD